MTATIIPFPSARRIARVTKAAEELIKRCGERRHGEGYRQNLLRQMAGQMTSSGIDTDTIERELQSFTGAVARQIISFQRHQGGGKE